MKKKEKKNRENIYKLLTKQTDVVNLMAMNDDGNSSKVRLPSNTQWGNTTLRNLTLLLILFQLKASIKKHESYVFTFYFL